MLPVVAATTVFVVMHALVGAAVIAVRRFLAIARAGERAAGPGPHKALRTADPLPTLPHAAVLLAVRGSHDHLEECLRNLLNQDYETFELRIVIDGDVDGAAWHVAHRVAAERPGVPVRIEALRQRRCHCSLKCNALLQMTRDLELAVDVLALVDADVLVGERWLRDLVAPLHRRGVGASFGLPVCVVSGEGWGAMLRASWWSFAGAAMALRGWPWGGSTAFLAETMRRSGIRERWAAAISSDTPLPDALRVVGLRAAWVPSLFVLDRDVHGIRTFHSQLVRYLLVRRLYLPGWSGARLRGTLLTGALGASALLLVWGIAAGQDVVVAIAGGSLLTPIVAAPMMLSALGRCGHAGIERSGIPVPRRARLAPLRALVAPMLLFFLVIVAALQARSLRRVSWRGVTYEVRGPWDVRLHTSAGPGE
jgi:hypothetical protein